MVAPRVYHGEYTLQETVILTQLNLNMQARDLERMQIGIQLCQTDPRLSSRFSTLNPRADIDRWDFHSVRLFTVEIWLE